MFNLEMFAPFIFFHMTNATIIKSATKHARTIIYSNDEPVKQMIMLMWSLVQL